MYRVFESCSLTRFLSLKSLNVTFLSFDLRSREDTMAYTMDTEVSPCEWRTNEGDHTLIRFFFFFNKTKTSGASGKEKAGMMSRRIKSSAGLLQFPS